MGEKGWVDEKLEDPEFRKGFIDEMMKMYADEIADLRRELAESNDQIAALQHIVRWDSLDTTTCWHRGEDIRVTYLGNACPYCTLQAENAELKAFKSAFPPVPDGKIARKMVEDRARAELLAESEEDAVTLMEVLEHRNTLRAENEQLKQLVQELDGKLLDAGMDAGLRATLDRKGNE